MTRTSFSRCILALLLLTGARTAQAQLRDTKALTLDGARNIMSASDAEARRNGWTVAIAVVDPSGSIVLFQRADGARPSNVDFALRKARTAAHYQRPTKALDSAVTAGRIQWLATDALPIEGGIPIVVNGQVIGAVGVSGATSAQDAQVAAAGIAALIVK